jgi:peptidoglycan/xylan/chitin deacetylase (PgdA/CDA1 family)
VARVTERDGRGAIAWPDGARCAAAVTFDVDCDSILHLDRPTQGYRRVGTQSWLRYDEVAVPAILDLYERLGLKQTFFVPGWCVERYPDLVRQIIEAGHELAAHGYQHELAHELDPARERALMERAIEAMVQASDRRPRGWRGPLYSFSDRTAEFLVEEGFHLRLDPDGAPPAALAVCSCTAWAPDAP